MKTILTSAQAAKLLRKLNEERGSLYSFQQNGKEFVAAVGEDVESVRPDYDFVSTQAKISEVERKIRALKHAINLFNTTTFVEGFDMTVDEVLVYIPQLTTKKDSLSDMKNRLPKVREIGSRTSPIIDYRYVNYDLAEVSAEYERISDELARVQTALDLVNTTKTLEVDL